MSGEKFCSNCGMLVYPGMAFCKNCGASVDDALHAYNGQTSPQSWRSLGIRVEDFKTTKDFNGWLKKMRARIK